MILEESIDFASRILRDDSGHRKFHTLDLASCVAKQSLRIGEESGLNASELEIVQIAAWFLYTGYGGTSPKGSLERSVQAAEDFLSSQGYDKTSHVLAAISAMVKPPESTLEQVTADAHSAYLSQSNYIEENKRLREELESQQEFHTDLEWYRRSRLEFVEHKFHTKFAKKKLGPKAEANRKRIQKFIKKLQEKQDSELERTLKVDNSELGTLKKKLAKVEKRSERGVETLYRLASKNLYTRLALVDSKSNILISINAIVISITIGSVLARVEEDYHLLLPIIMMLTTNLTSIALAILAIRPPLSKVSGESLDLRSESANLLAFENFYKTERDEYHRKMEMIANNADYLYSNITEDIFMMGQRLGKKYKYVRRSYDVFLYGIILSVVVFIICHAFV